MICLDCNREMDFRTVTCRGGPVNVELCQACGACWLDAGELDQLISPADQGVEHFSLAVTDQLVRPPKICPRCADRALGGVRFLGYTRIILDRCSNCYGVWLDGGELDAIRAELRALSLEAGEPQNARSVGSSRLPDWYFEFIVEVARHSAG